MTADEVYDSVTAWSGEYDKELHTALTADPDYARKIFALGRGGAKPRKDLAKWSDVKQYVSFFYDGMFAAEEQIDDKFEKSDIRAALEQFITVYDEADDQNAWFGKLKIIAEALGFAPEVKQYKQSPEQYKGHVGDIAMFLRVAVTGRLNSPDLYDVMHILGRQRVIERVKNYADTLV